MVTRGGYETLDEALASETGQVREVSEGGSVPTLAVNNTGDLPVLLVIGAVLVGAEQNRVLNTSLLVPASQMEIPVSCVEAGRWSYRFRTFGSSTTSSHLKLRQHSSLSSIVQGRAPSVPVHTLLVGMAHSKHRHLV